MNDSSQESGYLIDICPEWFKPYKTTKTVKTKFTCPVNPSRKIIDDLSANFSAKKQLTSDYIQDWMIHSQSRQSFCDLAKLYDEVQGACDLANNKTQWAKLLHEFCGGLSDPSKMPGYGWSIPAQFCKTGSKLRLVQDSTCGACYALKGRYLFDNVKLAMARRIVTFNQSGGALYSTFTLVLSRFLNWNLENPSKNVDPRYFRWFDSGDLQDFAMLQRIIDIAKNCPDIKFWLPTRELSLIALVDCPGNLIIRYSTPMVDALSRKANSTMVFSSLSILPDNCQACPATTTDDHTCSGNNCRSCWIPGHVGYQIH